MRVTTLGSINAIRQGYSIIVPSRSTLTQAGTGPTFGAFQQAAGNTTDFIVSPNWQGQIWIRTRIAVLMLLKWDWGF
jgi:hypothetical protein